MTKRERPDGGGLVAEPDRASSEEARTRPWVYVAGVAIVLGLVALFVFMHLAGAVPSH